MRSCFYCLKCLFVYFRLHTTKIVNIVGSVQYIVRSMQYTGVPFQTQKVLPNASDLAYKRVRIGSIESFKRASSKNGSFANRTSLLVVFSRSLLLLRMPSDSRRYLDGKLHGSDCGGCWRTRRQMCLACCGNIN